MDPLAWLPHLSVDEVGERGGEKKERGRGGEGEWGREEKEERGRRRGGERGR